MEKDSAVEKESVVKKESMLEKERAAETSAGEREWVYVAIVTRGEKDRVGWKMRMGWSKIIGTCSMSDIE